MIERAWPATAEALDEEQACLARRLAGCGRRGAAGDRSD
jgi:hypothetical protein